MLKEAKESVIVISDLCCSTEEFKIRKKLEPMAGVASLQFNVVSHKLTVQHSLEESALLAALKDLGLPGYLANRSRSLIDSKPQSDLVAGVVASASLLALGGILTLFGIPPLYSRWLFLAAIVTGGWQIAGKAYRSAKNLSLDMNFLMTIATIGAVAIGQYAEGAAVIVLYAFSLLLESMSMARSRKAIESLMKLSPPNATVIRSGQEIVIPADDVLVGDLLVIRPGERIALDGVVTRGHSNVDQAPITGESIPVPRKQGDPVFAGSFNKQGSIEVRGTKPATGSTLARIIHLVEEAQSRKAPSQTFIDRFAQIYTPSVFLLAIFVAIVPPLFLGASPGDWLYRALVLLVIACPCALVISTPVSLVSALTNGARHGILFKGGRHLEVLSQVRTIAFDKTGTLTEGKPTVTDVIELNSLSGRDILKIAAAAELKSEHHLADAVLRRAAEAELVLDDVLTEDFSSLTGKGIRATVDGKSYIVGSHPFIEELGVCSPDVERELARLEQQGKTVILLADDEAVRGIIAVSDQVRSESAHTVAELRRLGMKRIVLLTGDNEGTAAAVAGKLDFDEVHAGLLPEEKLDAIRRLKSEDGSVAMVGDGINDAPALAAADVGIAMGGIGSDTAMETADIVLMSDAVSKVPYAISLGKRTLRIVRENVALALATKAVFLVLGLFGMSSLWLAILADDGATLLVILNGLRLLKE